MTKHFIHFSKNNVVYRNTPQPDRLWSVNIMTPYMKGKSSPVTGLEWPRGFQVVTVPRFLDNGTGWW
jgi:hypothetical protein